MNMVLHTSNLQEIALVIFEDSTHVRIQLGLYVNINVWPTFSCRPDKMEVMNSIRMCHRSRECNHQYHMVKIHAIFVFTGRS